MRRVVAELAIPGSQPSASEPTPLALARARMKASRRSLAAQARFQSERAARRGWWRL